MFERFTDRARRVLVLAQEEARRLGQHFIGTEHILLGLIREDDGLAAQALRSLGVALDDAREKVQEKRDPAISRPTGSMPFRPEAKKVLELSLREALQLGHRAIDTEHQLLALARQGESEAIDVLAALGVDLDQVRGTLISLMSQPGYRPSEEGYAAATSAGDGVLISARATSTAALIRRRGGMRRLSRIGPMLHGWVVGLIDPAQRYMLHASGHGRPRRRSASGTASYSPLTTPPRRWRDHEGPGDSTLPPAEAEGRHRQRAEEHDERLEAVMRELGPLLDSGVQDLLERSETVMVTPSAAVTARIVRFRWGDSLLHVEIRRERRTENEKAIQAMSATVTTSLARLPRAGAEALKRYLTSDLADLVDP